MLLFKKIQKCRVRGPSSRPSSPDSSLTLRMTESAPLDDRGDSEGQREHPEHGYKVMLTV